MAGITFSIPNVFAGVAGPTEPLQALDDDFDAIQSALSGLVAALTDLPSAVDATGTRAWGKGANIADGATLSLGADGNYFVVPTGATAVTAISSKQAGCIIILRFGSARVLTHDGTALILMGATNATTASGDLYWFISEGGGNWRELWRRPVTSADATHLFAGNGTWTAAATPALTLNTTSDAEATTTSAAGSTLKNITITSVPTTGIVRVNGLFRKTAVADSVALAFGVNGTQISTFRVATGVNATAGSGSFEVIIGPQVANYLNGLIATSVSFDGTQVVNNYGADNATLPGVAITSIQILAKNTGGVMTCGVSQVKIYTQIGA